MSHNKTSQQITWH